MNLLIASSIFYGHYIIKDEKKREQNLVGIQSRDRIKTEYCSNNIKLLRIKYNLKDCDKLKLIASTLFPTADHPITT